MKMSLNDYGGCAIAIALSLFVRPAAALPTLGDLDTSFNAAGTTPGTIITTASYYHDYAYAIAMQADGKIVVAGSWMNPAGTDAALVRYAADGSLDSSFDGDGIVTTDFGSTFERAAGLVVQPDGKLVVMLDGISNGTDRDFALARYNADGGLDTNFGNGGLVLTDFGSTYDKVGGIALQSDGKLVVSGYIDPGGSVFDYALARYNNDGSLDTDFGTDGKVTTALGTNNDWDVTVTLQPDGKIVIGSAYSQPGGADFFLARYTSDGTLDTTFNPSGSLAAGVVTTDMGDTYESVTGVLVQPDGKIVATGRSGSVFALARFNVDGSLDGGFGTGGKLIYDLGGTNAQANAVALQPNGKIVLAGYSSNASDSDFAVVRFTPDGTPEGARVDPIGASSDSVYTVALQPDGKIVAAGYAQNGTYNDIAVARYLSNDAPWDLTPDAFSFTDASGVGQGSVQTSNMITVAGLDGGVSVPVTVSGGEYAVNGATTYTSAPGWVQNGDTVNVRQTAGSNGGQTTDTVLTVGGIMPGNDLAGILGTTVSDTFSVTTSSGGGGGTLGPWSIALFIAACRGRRRRARQRGAALFSR